MKKIILASILISSFFSACKKDKNKTTAPDNNTTTTGGSINTSSVITNGLPNNTNTINGVLLASKLYFPSFGFTKYISYAGFSATAYPLHIANPSLEILIGFSSVDTVKINNRVLEYTVPTATVNAHRYTDTLQTANYTSGVNWHVNGNSNFTTFNTTVTRGFPVVSNAIVLPLTLSKSQPYTLNFGSNAITNCDSVTIMLSDATSNYSVQKTIAPNITNVTFSTSELNALTTGSSSNQIFIFTKNYSHLLTNNKTYVFMMCSDVGGFLNVTP